MRTVTATLGLTMSALALLGLSHLVNAAETPRNMVAFKAAVKSKADAAASYTLPLDPPLMSAKVTGSGEAAPFGAFTAVEHAFVQMDVEGRNQTTDAVGVWSMANGDAVFITYKGLLQRLETAFVITGGKGRFRGGTGSGVMTIAPGAAADEFVCTFEGTITAPQ